MAMLMCTQSALGYRKSFFPLPLALVCLAKPTSTASGNSHLSSSPSNPREAWPSKAPFPNSQWSAPWPPSKMKPRRPVID
ncbi:hypothetical protein CCUS01_15915 [Colletotrichum cuscutae]|uniref:Uncharacterized protein n=1 Tax=Colletotrichum cuscutae TaxID=1209917 RepID=A0AAI9Y6N4_9PEZI|nr:hypothetical protein CCUS01_15915 [Colletotrichum cuscutae]